MYDTSAADLGVELKRLAQLFPAAIDDLFAAIILEPDTVNRALRAVDNLVKNVFHICEVARNAHEPFDVAVALAKQRLQEKRKLLAHLRQAVEQSELLV